MPSSHLVDPDLRAFIETFPALGEMSVEMLPMLRTAGRAMFADAPAPEDGVTVTEMSIPGPAGAPQMRILVYQPGGASGPRPAVLHIHGGGYIMGAPEMSDARNRSLAVDLGCIVVSVDYRLSPETPFPGPVEDCYAALKWLHANAGALGADPARIAVSGESAGGGLSASLALLARDRGEVPVLFQLLHAPMIDDRTAVASDHPYVGQFVWTRSTNAFGWRALLGEAVGGPDVSPYAAAARASDLAGLPPTFISVGALDLFLEEDLDYARRLTRAGVPTELHVYPGACHGFDMAPEAETTKAFTRDSRNALRRAFAAKA